MGSTVGISLGLDGIMPLGLEGITLGLVRGEEADGALAQLDNRNPRVPHNRQPLEAGG